jgi:PAS domain S-box-containing protein
MTPTTSLGIIRHRRNLRRFLASSAAIMTAVIGATVLLDVTYFTRSFLQPQQWLFAMSCVAAVLVVAMMAAHNIRARAHEAESMDIKFRGLLECAPEAILMLDSQGRIILANSRLEELLGYARHELLGRPLEELFYRDECRTENTDSCAEISLQLPSSNPESERELVARRKDGVRVPVEVAYRPLETRDGVCSIKGPRTAPGGPSCRAANPDGGALL